MQIVLVTGSAQGIGAQIALDFLKQGDYVVLLDRQPEEGLTKVQAMRESYPETCEYRRMDIGDHESVRETVDAIVEKHGRIDVLVNNAGVTRDTTLKKMSMEQWETVIRVNLTGTFSLCRAVVPVMIGQRYGRIINIASAVATMGNVGQANYGASKGGIIALTKSLALECVRYGITVNAVSPGFILTDMTGAMPQRALDAASAKIPYGSFGEPEDIANAVLFLAKKESRYIVGETINVNGGLYLQ